MSTAKSGQTVTTDAAHQGREWLEKLARLGYASRGAIYLVIGVLAVLAAIGQGGEATDTKGALSQILGVPGGWVLVLILALGLLGYSAWRGCQAASDTDGHGTGGKGLAIRGGLMVSSVTHLLLALWAAKLALGQAAAGDGGGGQETLVATLMAQPAGQWLVGILGLILIGVGLAQFAKGHGEKFEKRFTWDADERRKLLWICKVGLYARGVVFAIIGGFIVYAAITTNPSDAGGLAEAMQWLRTQPFGPWLMAAVAAGLVCFGIYSIVEAMYRRISTARVG